MRPRGARDRVAGRGLRQRARRAVAALVAAEERERERWRAAGLLALRPTGQRGRPERGLGWTARELAAAPEAPGHPPPVEVCELLPRPCPCLRCPRHLGLAALAEGESCERDVIAAGPRTQREVGRLLGLSRYRVAQLERRALAKVRAAVQAQKVRKDRNDPE